MRGTPPEGLGTTATVERELEPGRGGGIIGGVTHPNVAHAGNFQPRVRQI